MVNMPDWITSPDPNIVERQYLLSLLNMTTDDPSLSIADLRARTGAGTDVENAIKISGKTLADVITVGDDTTINAFKRSIKGDGVTDDRPAIQAMFDQAGPNAIFYFPAPKVNYLLASATQPGDRILRLYANQTIIGADPRKCIFKVADNFGNYVAVFGMLNGSTYCGKVWIEKIGIDFNFQNGNALDIPNLATAPRYGIILGSYTNDDTITINNCYFKNADNVNTLYLYAEEITVTGCEFVVHGGPTGLSGTSQHDHSTIYTTTTIPEGNVNIRGNKFKGIPNGSGARTAIETHGGAQSIVGNNITDYFCGMNITGICGTAMTVDATVTGNTFNGVAIGVHLWAQYVGAVFNAGSIVRNFNVSYNSINIKRDPWLGISGMLAYASGVLIDSSNNAPMDNVTIMGNDIYYEIGSGAAPASDRLSAGINLTITTPAPAPIRNLKIAFNIITNALSCGILCSAAVKNGDISFNTIENPGLSNEAPFAAGYLYRSGIVLSGTLENVNVDYNSFFDTQATHIMEYAIHCSSVLTSAINCYARGNTVRYTDGVNPRNVFWPSSNAGTAFYVENTTGIASLPVNPVKVGSIIREITTSRVYRQLTAPTGSNWVSEDYGTAVPASGTWTVGSRRINSAPAVGSPKSWVCTVAGTPGTWVSEGNL